MHVKLHNNINSRNRNKERRHYGRVGVSSGALLAEESEVPQVPEW
jgi:hypothetical protein